MTFLLAALLGLGFGAADQQPGTLTAELGPWTSTAAQVSAPWLVLPFLIGMTQQRARRAAVLGLVVTASALLGYFAMTYSPIEIHPWSLDRFISGMVAVTTSGYNPSTSSAVW
jgi:TctA family transporter